MRGRRIPLQLPNTGAMHRKRHTCYMRGIIMFALAIFIICQLHAFNYTDSHDVMLSEPTNDSVDAILSNVPVVLHKFLTPKTRNQTVTANFLQRNGSSSTVSSGSSITYAEFYHPPNVTEIKRQIARYNELQLVLNEDAFGPLQNDSVIIVVQVHTRITYLRHLIVSLAQAKDISRTLLIFSHDFYDEDINDLVQAIDFCKVMQIFYPHSIQTHLHEYPGVDPNDCPRDIKKEQALIRNCNNAKHPDLYGHYREAKFTQTKHHWWWKANRVFDQLEVTRYHTGLVLFLEEDHYVAEDFLYLLELMQKSTADLCPKCNILSLGTYLKTFNYYTYNSKTNRKSYSNKYASLVSISNNVLGHNKHRSSLQVQAKSSSSISSSQSVSVSVPSSSLSSSSSSSAFTSASAAASASASASASLSSSAALQHFNDKYKRNSNSYSNSQRKEKAYVGDTNTNTNEITNANVKTIATTSTNANANANANPTDKNNGVNAAQQTWSYHVLPSLYSVYQKVEVTPWISSKHNMGFAFNRSTWNGIRKCHKHFCSYDDYNWDWSLQHLSQQCLQKKLYAMIVKGPRVFHIGECGVHHKKKNCESNQVISKVQQVLRIARKTMYPRTLTLSVVGIMKKNKLRKGNGGWGDKRDHDLCTNMTLMAS